MQNPAFGAKSQIPVAPQEVGSSTPEGNGSSLPNFQGELPRGCLPKTGFGTFYSLESSFIQVHCNRIGSLVEGAPFPGQLL